MFVGVFLSFVRGPIFDMGLLFFFSSSELMCKPTLCSINLRALCVLTWIDMSTFMAFEMS